MGEFVVAQVTADVGSLASPFVRWKGNVYVPRRVHAQMSYRDRALIRVQIDVVEAGSSTEPQVSSYEVKAVAAGFEGNPPRPKDPVVPADVRIPWGDMIEAALRPLARRLVTDKLGNPHLELISDPATLAEAMPLLPRRRRLRVTPELLEEVANVYNDAVERGESPAQAVADGITRDGEHPRGGTVGRWIRMAKDAGLIPEDRS